VVESGERNGSEGEDVNKQPSLIVGCGILLVIGGLLFYWFQWRPSEIRKRCAGAAANFSPTQDFAEHFYQNCIRQSGLSE
jgi:hypothetical protein